MKKLALFIIITVIIAANFVEAAITVDVKGATGPSALGDANVWFEYQANTLYGLRYNMSQVGNPGPAQYNVFTSPLTLGDMTVSPNPNFKLWRGIPYPSGLYYNMQGNDFRSTLSSYSAEEYSLSQLDFLQYTSDPANSLGMSGSCLNYNYAINRVGVWYGPDQIPGNTDDEVRTSGSGALPVNELYWIGIGKPFNAGNELSLGNLRNFLDENAPFSITTIYTFVDRDSGTILGSGSLTVSTVPEPANLSIAAVLALFAFAAYKRLS